MNILAASEIKKRGITVIEEQLKYGAVHILKHNRPLFVVISEEEYQYLTKQSKPSGGLLMMLEKDATGTRSKQDIDDQLNEERSQWD